MPAIASGLAEADPLHDAPEPVLVLTVPGLTGSSSSSSGSSGSGSSSGGSGGSSSST